MDTMIDLDINNYDLNDILRLFDIPNSFTEADLKKAKNKMLKTHPDKSGLDPRFFRFYGEAYNMVCMIWEFKQKGNTKNTEYTSSYYDEEKSGILDNWFNENKSLHQNKGSFNTWFNKQFDNTHIYNEKDTKGYDDWLRNADDMAVPETITDLNKMNQYIDERKKILREQSLVTKREVQDIWSIGSNMSASDLSPNAPSDYDSGLFSGLAYQDLHKAHTETIIPITIEDYDNVHKFNTVNEIIHFRNTQDMQPLNEQQAQLYLNEKNKKEDDVSIKVAYNLAKQNEQVKQKSSEFWKNVQLLH